MMLFGNSGSTSALRRPTSSLPKKPWSQKTRALIRVETVLPTGGVPTTTATTTLCCGVFGRRSTKIPVFFVEQAQQAECSESARTLRQMSWSLKTDPKRPWRQTKGDNNGNGWAEMSRPRQQRGERTTTDWCSLLAWCFRRGSRILFSWVHIQVPPA